MSSITKSEPTGKPAGPGPKAGSKLTKAEQLGVPVLDEDALEQILATGEVPEA